MSKNPKKYVQIEENRHQKSNGTTSDNDERASVLSTASGTSSGSFAGPRIPFLPSSRSGTTTIRNQMNELARSRSAAKPLATSVSLARPVSSLGLSRGRSPIKLSTSPTKTRQFAFDSPVPSPTKIARILPKEEKVEEPFSLVDATIISDVDLSVDFDAGELSRMLADEQARESTARPDALDKVLVSIRVKPADNDDAAWNTDKEDAKLTIRERYARTTSVSNEYRYDNVLTGSNNKLVYEAAARRHVRSAMEGFNSVVFAYGQTASGKTYTLSGTEQDPGIIPRAMRDVFGYIKATPDREYLLRASYLEIYNEHIHDLLAPGIGTARVPVTLQGIGSNVTMTPLREEVVTSLKAVKEVMERGESNRRTANTDWNERSSRSHSVFRLVIESRERGSEQTIPNLPSASSSSKLHTPGANGVRMSVLSLIDLAGSEKATSDKERAKEGKYINTSLLTLGTVIGTLAENASKGKSDHVPFRNSKLTRMLQPSLSGDARISVICTLNSSHSAISESLSTLGFASRVKRVALNATKKEIVDHEALIERYRKEIDELKTKLQERDTQECKVNRRLSTREKADETRDKTDLNLRLKQLSKLILTSQSVDLPTDTADSPSKPDFDLTPYQLQEELFDARKRLDVQETQILSLEAALAAQPTLASDAPDNEKDKLISELQQANRELTIVVQGYEANVGEPLVAVKEDVEKEWKGKFDNLKGELERTREWAKEVAKELEREKRVRQRLEQEKRALASFVTEFDVHMREHTSYTSSLPRLAISTPGSLQGTSGSKPQRSGTILVETTNASVREVLSDLKEEAEEKENVDFAAV